MNPLDSRWPGSGSGLPYGLMFVIPPTVFAFPSVAASLSVRFLVAAAGITEERIQYWSLYGMSYDAAGGTSPLLDQLLTAPPGGNLEISVWIEHVASAFNMPTAAPAFQGTGTGSGSSQGAPATGASLQLLDAIETTWQAILSMELRISSIRKELSSNISRIGSLNRDLNSDERRCCDSKDIQAWTEARRWLRDALSTLSRSVKEIDVGTTSGAGQRHKFEEIYREYVVPRIPFAGLQQAVNEFEIHQKRVQTVLASAQANIAKAGRDAEQRANAVLSRIATKMRSTRR